MSNKKEMSFLEQFINDIREDKELQLSLQKVGEKAEELKKELIEKDPYFRLWMSVNTQLEMYSYGLRCALRIAQKSIPTPETEICDCPHFKGSQYFSYFEESLPSCKFLPFPVVSAVAEAECKKCGTGCYLKYYIEKQQAEAQTKDN